VTLTGDPSWVEPSKKVTVPTGMTGVSEIVAATVAMSVTD
jgi:hypothetical protein